MTDHDLARDQIANKSSAIMQENKLYPAFYDMETARVYVSCYQDGRLAPVHVYDGLPDEIAARGDVNVVAGFVLNGRFLTREQALVFRQTQVA